MRKKIGINSQLLGHLCTCMIVNLSSIPIFSPNFVTKENLEAKLVVEDVVFILRFFLGLYIVMLLVQAISWF